MAPPDLARLFDEQQMKKIFPDSISDQFFEALFGDPEEGAYDIHLVFDKQEHNLLKFHFELASRPDKCLRCSLTYGLPEVFIRHPIINLKGLAEEIDDVLTNQGEVDHCELGKTSEINSDLHVIPFTVYLKT